MRLLFETDNANCVGDSFDLTCTTTPCDLSSLSDSQYLQYKALFETDNANYTPKLYNVTVGYTRYSAGVDETSLSSTSQITDNNWHYAAVTYNNNTATDNFKLYLDGSLNNYKTEHNTSQYTVNDLYIGKNYQSTAYFNGVLDEFRIYDYALTPKQIKNNYNLNYNNIVSQ